MVTALLEYISVVIVVRMILSNMAQLRDGVLISWLDMLLV